MTWTPANKLWSTSTPTMNISYLYYGDGNLARKCMDGDIPNPHEEGTIKTQRCEYYIRDASGNLLALYEEDNAQGQQEHYNNGDQYQSIHCLILISQKPYAINKFFTILAGLRTYNHSLFPNTSSVGHILLSNKKIIKLPDAYNMIATQKIKIGFLSIITNSISLITL